MTNSIRAILTATLVAGGLDIISAFVFAGFAGMGPVAVLNYVASGPFGDAALSGTSWALAGLVVHFALMAGFVVVYMLAARNIRVLRRRPVPFGVLYGIIIWIMMYWVVKPLRWPAAPLPHTAYGIVNALFSHCLLVGLPIALIAARHLEPSPRCQSGQANAR